MLLICQPNSCERFRRAVLRALRSNAGRLYRVISKSGIVSLLRLGRFWNNKYSLAPVERLEGGCFCATIRFLMSRTRWTGRICARCHRGLGAYERPVHNGEIFVLVIPQIRVPVTRPIITGPSDVLAILSRFIFNAASLAFSSNKLQKR